MFFSIRMLIICRLLKIYQTKKSKKKSNMKGSWYK
nr:MAG TPA: hypothetical protein [Caudoviricetes sp.]